MISAYQRTSWPRPVQSLLGLPVRLGDVALGHVADLVLEQGFDRVVGFLVEGRGRPRLFLPWVAASPEPDRVSIGSVFALLSGAELDFYLADGVRLREAPDDAVTDARIDQSGALTPVETRSESRSQTAGQ